MKALLVVDSDQAYELISFYLKPLGFEIVRYRSPLKAMDNMDEIDPDAVIISAEDFPRHWKVIVQFIRNERNKEKTTIILLKGNTFSYEDAAKAVQTGVNGLAFDDLNDPEEIDRLQSILGRYRPVHNKRITNRVRPAEWDKVDFILSHPESGQIISGSVSSLSDTGLAFIPDEDEVFSGLEAGTVFTDCSLRVDSSILFPECTLVRNTPSFAFTFSKILEEESDTLKAYIQARPLRKLKLQA